MRVPESTTLENVEENARLSQSCVWRFQRNYFESEGPNAFATHVPSYVTSNPTIANAYAQVIIGFIRDWIRLHPEAIDEPFYMLELGAGAGIFGFYAIKRLCELRDAFDLKIKIKYVMSDLSQSNLQFWSSHPAFEKYVRQGVLEFMILDAEKDKKKFQPDLKNPLTIIANYFLDSIPQDTFYIDSKGLHEALVTTKTPKENISTDSFHDFEKIETHFSNRFVGDNYYGDELLDSILNDYKHHLNGQTISFPNLGLEMLKEFMAMSNGRLLLLSADKSYCTLDELRYAGLPELTFHGSFSMMVNMHAVGAFFKHFGGGLYHQTPRDGLKTAFCYSGFNLDDMPNLRFAAKEHLENFTPADFYGLQSFVCSDYEKMSYDSIVGTLALSRWDPRIFRSVGQYLYQNVNKASSMTLAYVKASLHTMAENFYFIPNTRDILFEIAIFFHTVKEWNSAIRYYQQSRSLYGEQYSTIYNLGLCHFERGELKEAQQYFQKAIGIQPDSKEAQQWLEHVEKSLNTRVR